MKELKVTCDVKDYLDIDDLDDFQGPLKTITQKNLSKLKNRIKKTGINVPLFIWKDSKTKSNYILDGHQRLRALRELKYDGWTVPEVPVVFIDAKDEEDAKEKLLSISSQYGDIQLEVLLDFTQDLEVENFTFKMGDLSLDYEQQVSKSDDTSIVDLTKADPIRDITKPGDIWTFGRHRLICADPMLDETYEKLMGQDRANLIITHPLHPDEELLTMYKKYSRDVSYYICMNRDEYGMLRDMMKKIFFHLDSDIIWDMGDGGVKHPGSSYKDTYENIAYARDEKHYFKSDKIPSNLWKIEGSKIVISRDNMNNILSSKSYVNSKPVELYVRAMTYSSDPNFIVLDTFSGDGTIFIAAEKMKRQAYGIESDTYFCSYTALRYLLWCRDNKIKNTVKINNKQVTEKDLLL